MLKEGSEGCKTWLSSGQIKGTVDSCQTNRVLCTRLQVQRLKHGRAFVFSAYGRKSGHPAPMERDGC
jgi:hypothetical protein